MNNEVLVLRIYYPGIEKLYRSTFSPSRLTTHIKVYKNRYAKSVTYVMKFMDFRDRRITSLYDLCILDYVFDKIEQSIESVIRYDDIMYFKFVNELKLIRHRITSVFTVERTLNGDEPLDSESRMELLEFGLEDLEEVIGFIGYEVKVCDADTKVTTSDDDLMGNRP